MNRDDMIVVVDGGGSGCRLGAFDARGTLCATATDGPASLSLGEEQTWRHIHAGLATLADRLGEPAGWLPARLNLGLSGALQRERRERFLALLPDAIETTLISDGHAQLLGACGGDPGICLAVGTGSVLHWLAADGEIGTAGGWGFPMGDEGSGAWLGAQLINAYLWYRDTRRTEGAVPAVFEALEEQIGRTVSEVQSWSTSKRSTDVASLAPIVVAAAERGDALADALLERGTRECERLIGVAPDTLPVYLVGGLAATYRPRLNPPIRARQAVPHGDAFSGLYALSSDSRWSTP